jgi:hypothetical protein
MNNKRRCFRLVTLLLLVFVYGCSPTVRVTTDFDPEVRFGEFRTFAVYDLKAQSGQISQLNADRILNSIRNEMIAKGFVESGRNPDLMINAVTILKNKTAVTANSDFYGYGGMYRPYRYWGVSPMMGGVNTRFDTYNYVDGSLVIDIVSTRTGKLIWQGIGNAQIDSRPKNPEKFIGDAIKKILTGFPPDLAKR